MLYVSQHVTKTETKAKIVKYSQICGGDQLFQNVKGNKGESSKTGKKWMVKLRVTKARSARVDYTRPQYSPSFPFQYLDSTSLTNLLSALMFSL